MNEAEKKMFINSEVQDAGDNEDMTAAIQHQQDASLLGRGDPPESNLHLQLLALEPDYGKEIPTALYNRLQKRQQDDKYQSLWEQLAFYNKSMRLGNLAADEMLYVRWHLMMAAHCLRYELIESFILYLGEAANIIETSNNKKGWLRTLFNKQFVEISRTNKQERKNMMGGTREDN